MADIVVNDIDPRNQYVAGGGFPTVFVFTFPIFALTDINVYLTPVGQQPNDVTQILTYNVDYTVTNNIPPAVGGTITLTTGAAAGEIITIVRNMPDNRLNNYIDGGPFQATDVNTDFDRCVMMNQQNKLYLAVPGSIGVGYNNSAVITPIVDNVLPLLPANCIWQMNSTHTAIQAVLFNAGAGGGGAVLPTVVDHFATFSNTTGTIKDSGFRAPLADGLANYVLITDGAFNTSFSSISSILPNSVSGNNIIINGDFQVWQRGAGGAAAIAVNGAANAYTADRWQVQAGAGTNLTVTQVAGATSGRFIGRVQRNAANAGVAQVQFGTSLLRSMCIGSAGNIVTLSFNARAGANFSSAGGVLTAQIISGTGNADVSQISTGFTGSTVVGTVAPALGAAFASYTVSTAALPANVTQLAVVFSFTPVGAAGANDYFDLQDVQLEISAVKTPFQRLSFNAELTACLPFYNKSFLYGTVPATNVGASTAEIVGLANIAGANPGFMASYAYPLPMIQTPTVVIFNPSAADNQIYNFTTAISTTLTSSLGSNTKHLTISYTGTAGQAIGDNMRYHFTADADIT